LNSKNTFFKPKGFSKNTLITIRFHHKYRNRDSFLKVQVFDSSHITLFINTFLLSQWRMYPGCESCQAEKKNNFREALNTVDKYEQVSCCCGF